MRDEREAGKIDLLICCQDEAPNVYEVCIIVLSTS